MLRRMMDHIYRLAEFLAAACVFAIFALILTQVSLGLVDRIFAVAGASALGLAIPSYAEIAAYLLVAATFLGLSSTLVHEVHVRVTLFLGHAPEAVARAMNVACGLIGFGVSAFFLWRCTVLVHESWSFGDTSYGQVAIPLWMPQSTMVVGLAFLTLAFVDFTWRTLAAAEED